MRTILLSGAALALTVGAALAQAAAPAPAGAAATAPAPAAGAMAPAKAPPPPPPGGPMGGPMADMGPDGHRPPPPPPPPRGAHVHLQRGDLVVDVGCGPDETSKTCGDTAAQLLDRLQAQR